MNQISEADQLKIINRSAQVGNAHRLLPLKNVSNVAIETWEHCFVGNLSDTEAMKMESFRFLWRRDDTKKMATIPFRGVAGNITQLKYLMGDNRIFREETGLELTEWMTILSLDHFDMKDVPQAGDTAGRGATSVSIKQNLDKIVNYITTDYYADPLTPGKATQDYFADVKKSRKAIDKVYKNAQLYLLEDLCPSFEDGSYSSWESVMKAVRRYYGKDECQETMIDRFKALREVINSNKRMEIKVIKFREIIRKFMVDSTDSKDMIKGRDFPDDRTGYQTVPERYSAFARTMFQFMVFDKCIPTDRWESIQTTFHGYLKEPTYKNWHENSPELYKIIDRESRKAKSPAAISENSSNTIYSIDSRNVDRKKKKGSERVQKKRKSSVRRKQKVESQESSDLQKEAMLRFKCKMCSRFAKRIVCHRGPYNGRPGSNCIYRKDGSKRRGYEAIILSETESSSEESSFSEDERHKNQAETEESCSEDTSDSESEAVGRIYGIEEGKNISTFRDAYKSANSLHRSLKHVTKPKLRGQQSFGHVNTVSQNSKSKTRKKSRQKSDKNTPKSKTSQKLRS